MKRNRGFSLFEVVIVFFLSSLILVVASRLAHETFVSLRFLEEKAQTVQSATLGLERLSSELREAVKIRESGTLVRFDKVDPQAPFALDYDLNSSPNHNPGEPTDNPKPDQWHLNYESDAFDRNQWGLVEYYTDGKRLLRKVSKGAKTSTSDVADNVNSFTVLPASELGTSTAAYRASLSLLEERRVVTFVTIVVIPGLEP